MSFADFFQTATGNPPYDYQRRLACGERAAGEAESIWLNRGTDCRSQLINIPTGLGKTAAVVLAWLWNRLHPTLHAPRSTLHSSSWPRRLVYCLPMRTLVEQTAREIEHWLRSLRNAAIRGQMAAAPSALSEFLWMAGTEGLTESEISNLPCAIKGNAGMPHSPIILMGGEDRDHEWDIYPEPPAILIGTHLTSHIAALSGKPVELREEPQSQGTASALSPAEQALVADLVADGLSIQDKFRPEPLYKQTGKGRYASETVKEIQQAKKPRPKGSKS